MVIIFTVMNPTISYLLSYFFWFLKFEEAFGWSRSQLDIARVGNCKSCVGCRGNLWCRVWWTLGVIWIGGQVRTEKEYHTQSPSPHTHICIHTHENKAISSLKMVEQINRKKYVCFYHLFFRIITPTCISSLDIILCKLHCRYVSIFSNFSLCQHKFSLMCQ